MKNLALRSLRESKGVSVVDRVRHFRLLLLLVRGDHQRLRRVCVKYRKNNIDVGSYFLAHSHYLFGEYCKAKEQIDLFLTNNPLNDDAIYLAIDILKGLGKKHEAWDLLSRHVKSSKRIKNWITMSNLVSTEAEYSKMLCLSNEAKRAGLLGENNSVFEDYLLLASLRAQRYEESEAMAIDYFCSKVVNINVNRPKSSFSSINAATALRDLKCLFIKSNIEMFLVSGTLLGCIREQSILPHDNDLDVGVWEFVSTEKLIKAVQSTGLFYIQTQRSPHTLRLRHVNGTPVDIFYHYMENEEIWHGGVKVRWYNTQFILSEHEFLGDIYLVPDNFNLYLHENYGNWEAPTKKFDSAVDTPNARVINKSEMIIHILNQLKVKHNHNKVNQYLMLLKEYGVEDNDIKRISNSVRY